MEAVVEMLSAVLATTAMVVAMDVMGIVVDVKVIVGDVMVAIVMIKNVRGSFYKKGNIFILIKESFML